MDKNLRDYEIRVITRRLTQLTNAFHPDADGMEFQEWQSREGFIETLIWIDEQEEIDRATASAADDS